MPLLVAHPCAAPVVSLPDGSCEDTMADSAAKRKMLEFLDRKAFHPTRNALEGEVTRLDRDLGVSG